MDIETARKEYEAWGAFAQEQDPDASTNYIRALEEEIARLTRERDEARAKAIEECAKVADAIVAPKSIGRDHARHHMAGAQSAARAIRKLGETRAPVDKIGESGD